MPRYRLFPGGRAFLQASRSTQTRWQPVGKEITGSNELDGGRLWDWVVVGTEGGYSSDNFVFFFLLALLMLTVAFYTPGASTATAMP